MPRLSIPAPAPGSRSASALLPILLLQLLFLLTGAAPASARADGDETPRLEPFYDQWLAGVAPLLSAPEKALFHELTTDVERDLFIHAFWNARAAADATAAGSTEIAAWWRRFVEARRRFGSLDGDRARTLLLAGPPAHTQVFGGCRGILRPLRVWRYDAHQARALGLGDGGEPRGFDLVFLRDYDAADGLFRAWSPAAGLRELSEDDAPWRRQNLGQILAYSRERSCFRTGAGEEKVLAEALAKALEPARLDRLAAAARPPGDWIPEFRRRLAAGKLRLPADSLPQPVAIGFPGRDASKVLVLGRIEVPVDALRRGAGGQLFDRLVLLGEARLGSWVANHFEQVYHLMGPPPTTDTLQLDFYRRLRPGTYELRLRLEDAYGRAILRRDLRLEVPALAEAPRVRDDERPVGGHAPLRELTRKQVVSLVTFPGIEILPPEHNPVGPVEIRLATLGDGVASVELRLDDGPPVRDTTPPFAATLDFGETPGKRRIQAVAFDAAGRAVARASHSVEPERPLAVRLRKDAGELRAELALPPDERVRSLKLFLDGALLASLEQPPWRAALPSPLPPASRFARAVVTTESGAVSEDLLFLDRTVPTEEVNVRLVEVYATVEGADGRPVTGLDGEDFRILEDGEPQALQRFDVVENLPIQVVLAMDTSVSMRDSLATAVTSARRFFSTVLTEKDRAALMTFNHDLALAVPFTGEVERLHLGASGLAAWGGTRLFDAVVFAGGYVGGHEGRRALVLLTDGSDVESDFSAEQARASALRAGVAVYPILLGVSDQATRGGLEELARASGGRAFSIRTIAQLDGVYRQIEEELRSQYLLVYEAPAGGEVGSFRRLTVETNTPGHRVRALSGYFR